MSRTPYTINLDDYVCSELERIRKMNETRDYSGLAAVVERIQYHATRMEEALYATNPIRKQLRSLARDESVSHAEFRERAVEVFDKLDKAMEDRP